MRQDNIIRFGIISKEAIAGIHAACINQIKDTELNAMLISSKMRAQEASKRYNVKAYLHFNELI